MLICRASFRAHYQNVDKETGGERDTYCQSHEEKCKVQAPVLLPTTHTPGFLRGMNNWIKITPTDLKIRIHTSKMDENGRKAFCQMDHTHQICRYDGCQMEDAATYFMETIDAQTAPHRQVHHHPDLLISPIRRCEMLDQW